MLPAWGRLHGESDTAYATFVEWLHGVDGNGLRPDLLEWSATRPGVSRSEIYSWARVDHWHLRAEAYDEWVGKRQLSRHFPLCAPHGVLMLKICRVELERLSAQQDAAPDLAGVIDSRLIDRWVSRVARMEATAAQQQRALEEASSTPGAALYDFTRLDLEELRVLETLHGKARVGT